MSSNKREGSHDGEATGKKPRQNEELESDDELPEESLDDILYWRTEDSFADWKIVIIATKPRHENQDNGGDGDGEEFIYNVRKCVLASGPRRSEYFVRLFEGNFSEGRDNTSRIELNELQAKAFPDLLDYMYLAGHKTDDDESSSPMSMEFSSDTATALYSLSKYFGVARLQNEVKKFCLQDMMDVDQCGTYYEHAKILQEDKILEPAAKVCRDNFECIDAHTSRLLHVPDPQFWLDLLKECVEEEIIDNVSIQLSGHISLYCRRHASVTSPEIFKQLTDEKYLLNGAIDPIDAVSLLDSERRIIGQGEEGKLSNLQNRCVNAIVEARGKLNRSSEEWIRNALIQLPPEVLCELVTRGLFETA